MLALSKKSTEVKKSTSVKSDPFLEADTLERFKTEVEKFAKYVEGLEKKSLNGPTSLDHKWKELMALQVRKHEVIRVLQMA